MVELGTHDYIRPKQISSKHLSSFKKIRTFNHDETHFKIDGRHKQIETQCRKCHTNKKTARSGDQKYEGLHFKMPNLQQKDCETCHASPHKSNWTERCTDCHTEDNWHNTKDFHKGFSLGGVHNSIGCKQCHISSTRLEGLSSDCMFCHRKDDIHMGSLPNCEKCHNQNFWESTNFKHSMSDFRLRGAHRLTECSECHKTGVYEGTPVYCQSCHFQEAASVVTPSHTSGSFFDCEKCHNQFTWDLN